MLAGWVRRRWRLRRAGTRGAGENAWNASSCRTYLASLGPRGCLKGSPKTEAPRLGKVPYPTLPYWYVTCSIVPLGLGSMAPRTVLRHPSEGWEL